MTEGKRLSHFTDSNDPCTLITRISPLSLPAMTWHCIDFTPNERRKYACLLHNFRSNFWFKGFHSWWSSAICFHHSPLFLASCMSLSNIAIYEFIHCLEFERECECECECVLVTKFWIISYIFYYKNVSNTVWCLCIVYCEVHLFSEALHTVRVTHSTVSIVNVYI